MEVFRLSRKKFATDLSGKGSALKGARWNSVGVELIYTAGNRSLAMAEVAVHFTLATLPSDYVMMAVFIPDDISLVRLNISDLPIDWNMFPHPALTQSIGDKFVADNKYCILQIPSAVTFGDYNFLINPNHPDFLNIKIIETVDFPFDKRVFR
ncbi:RES family NAD+ phosphorylase [Mucilaginibacter arboris]|uniref:RES domain-containing protein n=1 Tax=Mucilaginibacter arboris TaxID=2682090 RepID=A0A7K1T1M7_9SPHI|nr:RES family NAD+ phosphorylase [Mucilaginibacter arboris]MVN23427.1 RES domain-containing protein [Mucilaginibacter arboris]